MVTIVAMVRVPLILFDGVYNLRTSWVRFVVRRDPASSFRFAAQQSPISGRQVEIRRINSAGHEVPAAMFSWSDWRRIVILRFFVVGTLASNFEKVHIGRAFR
jgi:hypothetical protein